MSVGRGRGRGFVLENRETALRRPGQPFSTKYNNLIDLIDNLNINDDISGTRINDIVDVARNAINENNIKEVMDDLYKQAIEDRQFGIKFVLVFKDKMMGYVRREVLTNLQNDYEGREEIKKNNILHYRNAAALLGEIFNVCRIGKGRPLFFVIPALLDYLVSLLEISEEEDIEIVATQIFLNAQLIHQENPTELEDFIVRVRSTLINRNLSAKSRGMLLFILDFANQNFSPLSVKLQEFYAKEISINALLNTQRHHINLKVNSQLKNHVDDESQSINKTRSKTIPHSTDNTSCGTAMKVPKQGKILGFGENEMCSPIVGHEKPSVPRAIRGAGAADNTREKNTKKSPRGRKDKITDDQIWSSKQNTSSKVWGHDDRFDKDYD